MAVASTKRRKPRRMRVGRVSYFFHHGSWWVYYLDDQRRIRRRVGEDESLAEQIAAQVNAQLTTAAPTMFSFTPVTVPELRRRFLDYHESVLRSSLATVRRYRAATGHLEDFVTRSGGTIPAHEVEADQFVQYLRSARIAPNGHPHAAKRQLRDKGVRYILEVCRSLYGYAAKKRHLPPYAENPFACLGGKRFRVEDAKQVFVFTADTELAFFKASDDWAFPIHFTLAKTGLRPGELVHLLIEDLDLDGGWLRVRNKPELGWHIKTRRERFVPLIEELVAVLRRVIGQRIAGPVFLRQLFDPAGSRLAGADSKSLARVIAQHIENAEKETGPTVSRDGRAKIAEAIWHEAGTLRLDRIRLSFIRIAQAIGLAGATCPKSWRHSFATLLQDANVDPLIRQITLGHAPSGGEGALGMTSVYTHTRPETQRREILRALRTWPESLRLAERYVQGMASQETETACRSGKCAATHPRVGVSI
jgi:integrase